VRDGGGFSTADETVVFDFDHQDTAGVAVASSQAKGVSELENEIAVAKLDHFCPVQSSSQGG
jgi:hypothetical protein